MEASNVFVPCDFAKVVILRKIPFCRDKYLVANMYLHRRTPQLNNKYAVQLLKCNSTQVVAFLNSAQLLLGHSETDVDGFRNHATMHGVEVWRLDLLFNNRNFVTGTGPCTCTREFERARDMLINSSLILCDYARGLHYRTLARAERMAQPEMERGNLAYVWAEILRNPTSYPSILHELCLRLPTWFEWSFQDSVAISFVDMTTASRTHQILAIRGHMQHPQPLEIHQPQFYQAIPNVPARQRHAPHGYPVTNPNYGYPITNPGAFGNMQTQRPISTSNGHLPSPTVRQAVFPQQGRATVIVRAPASAPAPPDHRTLAQQQCAPDYTWMAQVQYSNAEAPVAANQTVQQSAHQQRMYQLQQLNAEDREQIEIFVEHRNEHNNAQRQNPLSRRSSDSDPYSPPDE